MGAGFGSGNVTSPQRLIKLVSVKKSGLGTPALSGSCANFLTVTDNGVGDYTINFNTLVFAQLPEVVATVTTDDRIVKVGTVAIGSVQILTENLAGTAAEADFHLLVVGSLARDLVGP
jgi:hypothetical protein